MNVTQSECATQLATRTLLVSGEGGIPFAHPTQLALWLMIAIQHLVAPRPGGTAKPRR
jgi:hypothetical protein